MVCFKDLKCLEGVNAVRIQDQLTTISNAVNFSAIKANYLFDTQKTDTLFYMYYANANGETTNVVNVTFEHLGYLSGVTSNLQTQLAGKQPTGNYLTAVPNTYLWKPEALTSYLALSGNQTLGGNITCTTNLNNYTFFGATPAQIGYLSTVSSNIQI